jgi:hypothetical protein
MGKYGRSSEDQEEQTQLLGQFHALGKAKGIAPGRDHRGGEI